MKKATKKAVKTDWQRIAKIMRKVVKMSKETK